MNYLYVLITAITVSIDSFICGLSLSIKNNSKMKIIFGISSVVFILCITAGLFGQFLSGILSEKCELVGGTLLILIAVYEFFSQNEKNAKKEKNLLKTSLAIGFAIGLDGACACLSLTVMYHKPIFLACVFTAFHLLFISISFFFAKKNLKVFAKCDFIPPLILLFLGVYKIVCCF